MLASLDKSKSCAAEKSKWCEEAGILETNQEGVVIEGKSLIIYMNMTPFAIDKYAANIEALSQKDRLEILFLRRIFNSVLVRTPSRQTIIDNI